MDPIAEFVVKQIDSVLSELDELIKLNKTFQRELNSDRATDAMGINLTVGYAKIASVTAGIVRRYSPDESVHPVNRQSLTQMKGVLLALKADYVSGRLKSFRQMVRADVFSDFLEMAEHLISEKYKDPAAVLAGGVLEQHIRKLCEANEVPTTFTDGKGDMRPKKTDTMNADLAKKGVYDGNVAKLVTAWLATRNSAAHAKWDEYDETTVKMMIMGIRNFMANHPA